MVYKMGWTKRSGRMFGKFGLAWVFGISITEFIGGPVVCKGPSMSPTIITQDILLTEAITPRFGGIKKGDIVICTDPMSSKKQFICKRIHAVEGEEVNYEGTIIKVPKSHFWIEGDNKADSTDSRVYGSIPRKLVKKRCVWKIWPKFCPLEDVNRETIDWAQYFSLTD